MRAHKTHADLRYNHKVIKQGAHRTQNSLTRVTTTIYSVKQRDPDGPEFAHLSLTSQLKDNNKKTYKM